MTGPRPRHSADEAVSHALAMVGHGIYQLGAGDIDSNNDDPRDCFGFAVCECFGIRRRRPGFNAWQRDLDGRTPSVIDDLNCNSAIEDADHARELFERADRPRPGDLIAYPTIRLPGHAQPWIGHVAIVVGVDRVRDWDLAAPDWSRLDVVQCCGPAGRRPGILRTDASHWNGHDATWPKPEHRTALLRVLP